MASAMYTDVKKRGKTRPTFCRPKEGLFGLCEWREDAELAKLVEGALEGAEPRGPTERAPMRRKSPPGPGAGAQR